MNKAELIAAMSEKTGLSKKDCAAALNATIDVIAEALAENEKVGITGFGSFEVKNRAARQGRNPRTNELVNIPAAKLPCFKAGKVLKAKVSNG